MATKRPKPPAFHDPVTKAEFERVGRPLGITNESMARWLGYSDESGFRKTFVEEKKELGPCLNRASGVLFRLLVAKPELRDLLSGGIPSTSGKTEAELRAFVVLIDRNGRSPDDWNELKQAVADFKDTRVIEMLLDEGLIERRKPGRTLRSGRGDEEWFAITNHARRRLLSVRVKDVFDAFDKDREGRFKEPLRVRGCLVNGDGNKVEND